MPAPLGEAPVVVIGAGISGTACARALRAAGVPVRVLDRGRRVGGRMALRRERIGGVEHVVDIGASYFTVSDPAYAALADDWRFAGPGPGGDRTLLGPHPGRAPPQPS